MKAWWSRFYCLVRWLYSWSLCVCVFLNCWLFPGLSFYGFLILSSHPCKSPPCHSRHHTQNYTLISRSVIGDIWSQQTCHSLKPPVGVGLTLSQHTLYTCTQDNQDHLVLVSNCTCEILYCFYITLLYFTRVTVVFVLAFFEACTYMSENSCYQTIICFSM